MAALSKSEKALVYERKRKRRIKTARRFVERNLWRVVRILKTGSDGRRDDARVRRFRICVEILNRAKKTT